MKNDDVIIECGFCKSCKWRDEDRYCTNADKIDEDYGQGFGNNDDRMLYIYMESGGFKVGDNFGCVHFNKLDI